MHLYVRNLSSVLPVAINRICIFKFNIGSLDRGTNKEIMFTLRLNNNLILGRIPYTAEERQGVVALVLSLISSPYSRFFHGSWIKTAEDITN